ncbi:MAG: YggT family protein [Peptoanaerobacter stomatis]|uniref:YggT family protein n=1 Tax=Peptoanaerobacter stomatis TaxID=796937 RepID=UPI003F9EFBA5
MVYIIIDILNLIYKAVVLLITARVIISWIPSIDVYREPVRTIIKFTDLILEPIRNVLDRLGMLIAIDISPIIAFLILRFVFNILIRICFIIF